MPPLIATAPSIPLLQPSSPTWYEAGVVKRVVLIVPVRIMLYNTHKHMLTMVKWGNKFENGCLKQRVR